jgi:hypothetical protein
MESRERGVSGGEGRAKVYERGLHPPALHRSKAREDLGQRGRRGVLIALALAPALRREREHDRSSIRRVGVAADEAFGDERFHELGDRGRAQLEMLRDQTRAKRPRAEREEHAAALGGAQATLLRGAPRDTSEVRRDGQEATREAEGVRLG